MLGRAVWKRGNPESRNGTGTSELEHGDVLRVLLTILALERLFILIRCIHFVIVTCSSNGAKF